MPIEEIHALYSHLGLVLKERIVEITRNKNLPKPKAQHPCHPSDPERKVKMVKAFILGEPQGKIAEEYGVSTTSVKEHYLKFKVEFANYLQINHPDAPVDKIKSPSPIPPEVIDQFVWFLDHYHIINGLKYVAGLHIPASKKIVNEPIDTLPLPKDVVETLKYNKITNMQQVADMSKMQIYNLRKMKKSTVEKIMRYFALYHPSHPPEHYRFIR